MDTNPEGITNSPIDDLLEKVDSKYQLMIFVAKRAWQINTYYSRFGEGLLENASPLVSVAPQEKPLSVALRELQDDLLQYTQIGLEAKAAERAATEVDLAFTFVDPLAELDANSPSRFKEHSGKELSLEPSAHVRVNSRRASRQDR